MTEMIYLESVGTFLDTKTKMTHPANSGGTPDLYWGMAVTLDDEVSEERFDSLSPEDRAVVDENMNLEKII